MIMTQRDVIRMRVSHVDNHQMYFMKILRQWNISILARHLLTHYARTRTYSACCGNIFCIDIHKMVVYRIPETNRLFLRRSDVRRMGCRMQEKKSNFEHICIHARECVSAGCDCECVMTCDRDKEVDGNVSVGKCLADSGKVYSRGSSAFHDLDMISYGDCRDIRWFIFISEFIFFLITDVILSLTWRTATLELRRDNLLYFYKLLYTLQILHFFKYPYLILKIKNTWYKDWFFLLNISNFFLFVIFIACCYGKLIITYFLFLAAICNWYFYFSLAMYLVTFN